MHIRRNISVVPRAFSVFLVTTLTLIGLAIAGTSASAQPAGTATSGPVSLEDGYVLGPGDTLEIAVLGREDYRARIQVQVDGTIQLPLINDVQVANRTVLQIRDLVKQRLTAGGYFTDPAVSVMVVSYASRYVNVLGEVSTPGNVPIDRSYQLSDILARVGGTTANAADTITVTREDGQSASYDIRQVATGTADSNPTINPGDRVFVDMAPQFYISGQINSPGVYRLVKGMTLRMALARGGGVAQQGSSRRISVYRDGVEMKKFDPNGLIMPDDNIFVEERFF